MCSLFITRQGAAALGHNLEKIYLARAGSNNLQINSSILVQTVRYLPLCWQVTFKLHTVLCSPPQAGVHRLTPTQALDYRDIRLATRGVAQQ